MKKMRASGTVKEKEREEGGREEMANLAYVCVWPMFVSKHSFHFDTFNYSYGVS